MRGDKEGEYTFTGGMGGTVIAYIMESEEIRERIREIKVEDKIDSVHQPIEAAIKGKEERRQVWKGIWNEERRKCFTEDVHNVEVEGNTLEEE